MYCDPRGGSNKKKFNENFFKTWSEPMAYVLGFISADGSIIDARKSSRTCYTSIGINDRDLLESIRMVMKSKHPIRIIPGRFVTFRKKTYFCKQSYLLRFGSKILFQDLINLNVTPRKSLRLKFPPIPHKYMSFFVRGYFDGDGCVNIYKRKINHKPSVQVIFTSGCQAFLQELSTQLSIFTKINIHKALLSANGGYQLRYKKSETIKILNFIYKDLYEAPFLERKYVKAKPYLSFHHL